MSYQLISAQEAAAAIAVGNGVLLDVRTPSEYEEVHVENSALVPLDILDRKRVETSLGGQNGALYILCASGIRSVKASSILKNAGFSNLYVIEGGIKSWQAAGLNVIRGKKTISLERQVRIGAGLLVLAGLSLGWFIHPAFLLLSTFVGAGLVFAGVTDICGLAIFLAKAPWNRSSSSIPSTAAILSHSK